MGRKQIPVVPKACGHCGAMMERLRYRGILESRLNYSRRRFCNRGCMAMAMVKERCQSESHSRMKAARTAASSCSVCGVQGRLHVHHLDWDHFNNAPSNLQTLCPSCHRKSHSPNYTAGTLTRKSCAICSEPLERRGLCATHLSRLRRHGSPFARMVRIGSEWVLVVDSAA